MPFGDKSPYEEAIQDWLANFSLADILEMSDITEEQVLEILLEEGHIKLPPFLERASDYDD